MLDRVVLKNFRCFRELDVPLRPLTVLIGPNDSGKSAFVAALQNAAAGAAANGLWDRWRGEQKLVVSISGSADGHGFAFDTQGKKAWRSSEDPFNPFCSYLLPSQGISMRSPGYPDSGDPPAISKNGEMIPALLDHLLRRDPERRERIVEVLRKLIPGFEKLEIGTPTPSERQIDFVIENGLRIPADVTSVGVRLLLFFVALAYHPTPPKLIVVEEPENGVHPKRLKDVIGLLREISQGVHGDNAAQVILTTHSPHLLDCVDVTQDQVLVFRRCKDGSRTAEPADEERLKNFLDEFMLGEVWFNEGEDGLVGHQK